MPHLQYATYADMVKPDSAAASSELVGFPAENVKVLGKPFQSWRSATGSSETLKLTFNTPKTLVGIYLDQVLAANVQVNGQVTVAASEVGVGSLFPMLTDERVNRRKALMLFPATAYQVLTFYPIGALGTDPEVPGFEIGDIVPITAWRDFPDHFQAPLSWRRMQTVTAVGRLGGGTQQQRESKAYVQLLLGSNYFKYIALSAFLTQLNSEPGDPILIYENHIRNTLAQAYLMQRLAQGGDQVDEMISVFKGQMVFEELI